MFILSTLAEFWFQQGDFLLFCLVAVMMMTLFHRLAFSRMGLNSWVKLSAWAGLVAFLVMASNLVEMAEKRENARMRAMLEGFVPTYAAELEIMGHEAILTTTPPDDPQYLIMIEAQKRWLKVNAAVNDVYTVRVVNGKSVLIVDSETDYNRNGEYDGDREVRTAIGEAFEPDQAVVDQAAAGVIAFSDSPTTDRWGTWVSAYAPIRDKQGVVEAILAVDFDAAAWIGATDTARLNMLGYLTAFFLMMTFSASAVGVRSLAKENEAQRRSGQLVEQSRSRLETLIHSIDGVVWEWDIPADRFVFVSRQVVDLLGYPQNVWVDDAKFWHHHLPTDDLPWVLEQRHAAANKLGNYLIDYRMKRADGRMIWVRERGVAVKGATDRPSILRGILSDITASKTSAEELENLNKQLVETSRQAGMAEVASGVLHNVGNVLNSVNVSSTVISDVMNRSKVAVLLKVAQLLHENQDRLAAFFSDTRGAALPKFLNEVSKELQSEHHVVLKELEQLLKNISHIKQIVMMQQSYARTGGNTEPLKVVDLVEDALRINESAMTRHSIRLVRDFTDHAPLVMADRNKILQILVNLIRNAKHALDDGPSTERVLVIGIQLKQQMVAVSIKDNGIGIPPENIARLFSYGFTTKKDGHGFGLHSGVNAAREMGGSLYATSEGFGTGATFFLELPVYSPAVKPGEASSMLAPSTVAMMQGKDTLSAAPPAASWLPSPKPLIPSA
jgi:PAS domain S-box-containing protein